MRIKSYHYNRVNILYKYNMWIFLRYLHFQGLEIFYSLFGYILGIYNKKWRKTICSKILGTCWSINYFNNFLILLSDKQIVTRNLDICHIVIKLITLTIFNKIETCISIVINNQNIWFC